MSDASPVPEASDLPPGDTPIGVDQSEVEQTLPPKRERQRRSTYRFDNATIANRVVDFFEDDDKNRSLDIEARLQREAKYRMWTEGKDWPWEDASDAAIPDMMTHSLKVQDTLHNAVMSSRPAIGANAIKLVDSEKEDTIDNLLDFQFFVENKGEVAVGEMAEAFVNDGYVCVFTPWVHEEREIHEIHTLPPLPDGQHPENYFARFLHTVYPGAIIKKADTDGWSWEVMQKKDEWFDVDFYTVNDVIEMDAQKEAVVFDAPRPIVLDYEDILAPVRSANLQIPSPSNPNGAAHVLKIDYPSIDEIKRLKKSGYYDLLSDEDLKTLSSVGVDRSIGQQMKVQKDVLTGYQSNPVDRPSIDAPDHSTITRIMCFDMYDLDGDGVNEDVVWWVLKEPKLLLRARELTQVYPANPPRRPFAEASFVPVRGRRAGISLLEMMEGLHDLIKQFADQTIDGGTIKNVPFFFYRAASNMRPETIRMWPGEGYPLADPKNDVSFPSFPQDGSAFGFNLMTMFGQMEERLTNIGDLQLGRVPQGKASALRTVRGMQSVMGQGDARPERILRRFFMCLTEVYAQMHELNQVFLPRDKQYRIAGDVKPNEDPYRSIRDPNMISGRFQFDFSANALNTSKEAIQDSLQQILQTFVNPMTTQMGIVKPENIYRMLRDLGKALGQKNVDDYISEPTPDAGLPKMYAEEVITSIMAGDMPVCQPAEADPQEHLKTLEDFYHSDEYGLLTPHQTGIFKAYLAHAQSQIQQIMQRQAQQSAVAQSSQGGPPGVPGPQGTAPINTAQAPLQKNELLDESLPSAGGGGNHTLQ